MFPKEFRRHALSRLDTRFDLLVIGGGVTGAGILMDAALRGLRVLLIEKDDIASGTQDDRIPGWTVDLGLWMYDGRAMSRERRRSKNG